MNQTASSPRVSVIVPLFNEEENVPILQAELRAALKAIDHEFIFVDDGSADHTVERIEPAPNLRVIRFEKNAGQSAAMLFVESISLIRLMIRAEFRSRRD